MTTSSRTFARLRPGLPISSADTSLSVLPLSHIFERTVFYVFAYMGVAVHYALHSIKSVNSCAK
jgi:long-subunit acyl-CoA synthetase (AMP-forming)